MKALMRIVLVLLVFLAANGYGLGILRDRPAVSLLLGVCFVLLNLFPSFHNRRLPTARLRACADGCELLLLFLLSVPASAACFLFLAFRGQAGSGVSWVLWLLVAAAVESVVFWNGILRVYLTSRQLTVKWRLIGVLCGWIPVVHLFVLRRILRIARNEVNVESQTIRRDEERHGDQICRTRYPLLLVHGVFFRDFRYFNYWGRIPKALERNGAVVHYGNQQSAASVADSGRELAERIRRVAAESGCGKVNLIAHSKGGLDCRFALGRLGVADCVASLTTINTPHRGCRFADYLLDKFPERSRNAVARNYNAALKRLGDDSPDFLAAVGDLTALACEAFNEATPDVPGVFYQSVGSRLNRLAGGRFPLNLSYPLVKHFDGPNDGLVSAASCAWGSRHTFLTVNGPRGISHGDMIDLNRENIEGFDVREFYVGLVHDLKARGL